MEEWGYLEGHKDLYKEVMMDNQPPLTSPDGSSNRNPPQRSPHPLDSTQEDPTIPHHDQNESLGDFNIVVKEEFKEEDEEYGVMKEHCEEHNDFYKYIMMESSIDRSPPERCPHLLYSTQEDHPIPPHDQGEDLINIKVEDDIEETDVGDDLQYTEEAGMMRTFKEEDTPTEIRTGQSPGKLLKDSSTSSLVGKIEDEHNTSESRLHSVDRSSNPCDSYQPHTVKDGARSQGEKKLSCPECGESFSSELSLAVHQRFHTGGEVHSCSECGKHFLYKSELIVHYRSHTGEKPYSCPECGKCFSRKSNLTEHQICHTRARLFTCLECGKCYTRQSGLLTHQRSHTGEKPFSCPECGKCFSRKFILIAHQRSHTGEKPYSCPECGKCFPQKSELITHQRSHTGEKPYPCPDCGKCFADKTNLSKHQRLHRGEKRYSCPECGKCFSQKHSLNTHQRSHTGERPYSCAECGKCFSQKAYLTKHHRSHTTLEEY